MRPRSLAVGATASGRTCERLKGEARRACRRGIAPPPWPRPHHGVITVTLGPLTYCECDDLGRAPHPYDLRHTYATFSIAAGVSLFALARRMGTSLEMIDRTYGHLAPDADEYELGLLDAFDARISDSDGHLLDTAD